MHSRFGPVLALVALASAAAAITAAHAQTYPTRPIRVVVPFPPVGAADLVARITGQKLAEVWNQQVLVENRPGAGGNIGAEVVVKAAPDGYMLLMAPITSYAVGMAAYSSLNWNLERDLVPVAMGANIPHILVAHPSLPVKNVMDVIALGKARPNELNFASQGQGTLSHLEQEMLKQMGGFRANHIPYKGSGPGLLDLIPGNVQLFFDSIPSSAPYVKTGKLKGIGVSSSKRSPALPDIPALNESLKGFEADSWFGLLAPVGTPPAIIAKFNAEMQKVLANPDVKEKMLAQGAIAYSGSPEQLGQQIKADVAKWGKVVRTAGVKIEN